MLNYEITNHEFCYWLQGYFEISKTVSLNQNKILQIIAKLLSIKEPLNEFTEWLKELTIFLGEEDYRQGLIDYFLPIIQKRLNHIFYHVIDNSYETTISLEDSLLIHNGILL